MDDTGSSSNGGAHNSDDQDPFIWAVHLVGHALEGDRQGSTLYALLAHSALSLWVGGSSVGGDCKDRETRSTNRLLHRQYLALALRAQRCAVAAPLVTSSSTASSIAPETSTPEALSTLSSATTTTTTAHELADARCRI